MEIAVSHFVDLEKAAVIEKLKLPALEISLNKMERESWGWAALEDAVIYGTELKTWLFQSALNKAANAALMKPLPFAPKTPASRIRLYIHGEIVDLIDPPFGVAVWTPYNPEINEIIKSIARSLGGRWQPKYRNWLFPSSVRPWLLRKFHELADPPGAQ